MIYLILSAFVYFIPGLWVNYTLNKHNDVLPNMPFTAKEFGEQLLKEKGLDDVKIETTKEGDHYSLTDKTVRVEPSRLDRKSLTSITVMCHEIGHAIQHAQNYSPLITRTKLVKNTQWINKINMAIIYIGFPLIFATGFLSLIKLFALIILLSTLIGVIIHLITLEVELDASFNRAFPIIKKKIPKVYHNSCRSVLRAAAFTYVVGVFKDLISLRMIWTVLSKLR